MERVDKMDGVFLTPLKIMENPAGEVLRGLRKDDRGFCQFAEAYFSTIRGGAVKAWKRHREMTLNLVVPVGEVRFVVFDDREGSSTCGSYFEAVLSRSKYSRLTVAPRLWVGFEGISNDGNLILNIADIIHDPTEVDRVDSDAFMFFRSRL